MIWDLVVPAFSVRKFIAGDKLSLFSLGSLLLTLSLFSSLFLHVVIVCFLGYAHIFLVPVPMATLAFVVFVTKRAFDPDFQNQSLGEKIIFSLLSGIFPMSSRRPRVKDDDKDATPANMIIAKEKKSAPEMTFLYITHACSALAWMTIFYFLLQTNPDFKETMTKIRSFCGVSSSWAIFLGGPLAFAISILLRLAYETRW